MTETEALDELLAAKAAFAEDKSDEAFARMRAAMEAVEAVRAETRADRPMDIIAVTEAEEV